MASKKILILVFLGIFLILIFGRFVDSWAIQKKIDWDGNLYNWNANYYYDNLVSILECNTWGDDRNNDGWHVYGNSNWNFYECNKVSWSCTSGCAMQWEAVTTGTMAYITCLDGDNDNHYSNSGGGCNPADCDDNDISRYYGAIETCDGKDNNCDGSIDEGGVCSAPPVSCSDITDIDGDGFGLIGGGICNWQMDCDDRINGADGIAGNADDGAKIYPGAPELGCDGIVNNCLTDYGANENIHSTGTENSLSSCADGFDNDCDGLIDCADSNSCPQTNCIPCTNADNDNYCKESSGVNCISTNVCAAFGDCDDADEDRFPGNPEVCDDNIDNDCDTYTDFDAPFCWGAYWASDSQGDSPITNTNADGSQIVYLISKYPSFIDQYFATHDFEIYEENSLGEDDAIRTGALGNKLTKIDFGDRMIAEWTITQADITKAATDDSSDNVYEFYFNISNPTSVIAFQSPILIVDWTPAPCTSGTQSCYTGASETEGIGECQAGIQTCANSVWGVCQGEIKPAIEICGDNLVDSDCDGIAQPDETGCSTTSVDCSQYNLCSSATTSGECTEADSCEVSSLDGCLWNSGVCNPYEDLLNPTTGETIKCEYTEGTADDCTDGSLTYSLTTLTQGCEDKKDVSIFCSAQTSLPLENKFGIFLTIISIIGIYFIFFRIKKILKYKK